MRCIIFTHTLPMTYPPQLTERQNNQAKKLKLKQQIKTSKRVIFFRSTSLPVNVEPISNHLIVYNFQVMLIALLSPSQTVLGLIWGHGFSVWSLLSPCLCRSPPGSLASPPPSKDGSVDNSTLPIGVNVIVYACLSFCVSPTINWWLHSLSGGINSISPCISIQGQSGRR